jgi:hypothetical protein
MPDIAATRSKRPPLHKIRAGIHALTCNIASVATAIEALEALLIEKNVLKENELMERLEKVAREHWAKGENIPPSED